jgi:flagellar basal body-associated protein FliL
MAKQDDFSEKDNPQEGNNSDDNFGLPEIEYKPLESQEGKSESSSEEEQSNADDSESAERKYAYEPEPEPKSNAPIIIAIIIGLVVLVAGYLIYQYVIVPQSEKAKQEEFAKQEAARLKREEAARLAKEKEEAERAKLAQQQAEAEKPAPAVGTIETLTDRTGRYYIVITSDLDDDLIMDYAKKLSADGTSSKIIPPFGKSQFHRLAIGDYDTFANAQTNADELKAKYGNSVWVLKY